MAIARNITDVIGRTPMVRLAKIDADLPGNIVAKLESRNPGGSVKDRIAYAMLDAAEKSGALKAGGTIVEPTSGNTGVGLAMCAAALGYHAVFCMPESMSMERRKLLSAFGAELVLTPKEKGMSGAVAKATELSEANGWFMPQQFKNAANPEVHRRTTAEEIWADTEGNLAAFVVGVGTGGSVTGVGEFLREKNADVHIVVVEPDESPVLSGGSPSPHPIQGIGAGFVPDVLDTAIYDEIIRVSGPTAKAMARELAKSEGVLGGVSCGAALQAAVQVASRPEMQDKYIVVILPDSGERYLSTDLFPYEDPAAP